MITKQGGTTCNSQLFRDSVPDPGLFLFLPCETCAYAVSHFWPWHDVLHQLSLHFSCLVSSFFLLSCLNKSFSRALLTKHYKRSRSSQRVHHVSGRLPVAKSASYKWFRLTKNNTESSVEGGRGKAASDRESLNDPILGPSWPQTAELFGSGLHSLIMLHCNETTNWWVLCSSKIKVTLARLAAVDD